METKRGIIAVHSRIALMFAGSRPYIGEYIIGHPFFDDRIKIH
jgi:hypothetical protein